MSNPARTLAGRVLRRLRNRATKRSLARRINTLEAEVQENRQLNRRIAELTDVVTELLVPVDQRDAAPAPEKLERYRATI
jgi:uncharacterized protein YigA (DUF484 family)